MRERLIAGNGRDFFYGFYYSRLSFEDQRIYGAILKHLIHLDNKFDLKFGADRYGVLINIIDAVFNDNPMLFYIDKSKIRMETVNNVFRIHCSYYYDKKTIQEKMEKIGETVSSILQTLDPDKLSDYEKERCIHDFIVGNTNYDYSAAAPQSFTVEGALLNHRSVCEGFSKLAQLLFAVSGLDPVLVKGVATHPGLSQKADHAWNMVRVGGRYYHVDVTWDHTLGEQKHLMFYDYFNLTNEEIRQDHTWNELFYPVCDSKNENYFIKNNCTLSGKKELVNFLENNARQKEKDIYFKMRTVKHPAEFIQKHTQETAMDFFGECKDPYYSKFEIYSNEGQLTFRIRLF